MTPEEKAITEKPFQAAPSEGASKVPLREDTFKLVGSDTAAKKGQAEEQSPSTDTVAATDEVASSKPENVNNEIENISNEALTKAIDDKLLSLKKVDFVTISINKLGAMVGVGIILVLIWLLPVADAGLVKVSGGAYSLADFRSDELLLPKPTEMPAIVAEAVPQVKIRLKTNDDSLAKINRIEMKLRQAGFAWIETVYEAELTNEGLLIAVRDDNQQLQETLSELLQDDYLISSESATLTDDSDFSAAILVDGEAEISATE
jgi:hypothetical protein